MLSFNSVYKNVVFKVSFIWYSQNLTDVNAPTLILKNLIIINGQKEKHECGIFQFWQSEHNVSATSFVEHINGAYTPHIQEQIDVHWLTRNTAK